jgi:hypothetical protein
MTCWPGIAPVLMIGLDKKGNAIGLSYFIDF